MSDPLKEVMAEKTLGNLPDDFAPNDFAATNTADDSENGLTGGQMTEVRPSLPTEMDDEPKAPIDEASKALALEIANAADDRKAGNITILQTGDISYLADYFVIVTGFSNVQVRAIANSIEDAVEDKFDRQPLRTEGMSEGRWVLKDYGEVIVHIFMPDDRDFYDLEAFWGHAERIEFIPESPTAHPVAH